MITLKKSPLMYILIPLIVVTGFIYFFYLPKSVSEYTSGRYEDLILGESKENLISRLKDSNHGFSPQPLNPDRDKNWLKLDSLSEKEYGFLMGSDVWKVSRIEHSRTCDCPIVMMHFKYDKLSKVRVECWRCW